MTLRFYTYTHRRATDGLVFYVGKGVRDRAYRMQGRNEHWTRSFKKYGVVVEIVAYWFSEAAAFDHEKSLIAEYKKLGQPLCNKTEGGEGLSGLTHSAATRAKIADKHIGMKPSPETCAKISAGNKGKIRSEEFKLNVSESRTGHGCSEQTRAKIGAKHKGKIVTKEQREKIAKALTGKILPKETRDKISLAGVGRAVSPETREKIRNSNKAHSAKQSDNMKKVWAARKKAAQLGDAKC